jgi:hypothetical protein
VGGVEAGWLGAEPSRPGDKRLYATGFPSFSLDDENETDENETGLKLVGLKLVGLVSRHFPSMTKMKPG